MGHKREMRTRRRWLENNKKKGGVEEEDLNEMRGARPKEKKGRKNEWQ